MNSPDPLVDLLHAADDAAPRPQLVPDLAAAVHRRNRQRASRRNRLAATSALAATVAFVLVFAAHQFRQPPVPPGGIPAVTNLADLARLKSEAAALKSQADDLDRQLHFARNEQNRQKMRDEYRIQFAQAAVNDLVPSPQDQAALIALGQGDYYWQTRREEKPAEAAYQSILDNYPGTRWAAVAKERLQQFQMN